MLITRVGDRGTDVAVAMSVLSDHGYWDRPFGPNPLFTEEFEDAIEYWQSTHLGPDGEPLDVDGAIGDGTRWSFDNPDGDAQRSWFEVGMIPEGLSEKRRMLLLTAIQFHGAKEDPNGSNRGPIVDKFLPAWWLNAHRDTAKGPAWCAFFVGAMCDLAFGDYPVGGHYGGTHRLWRAAKAKGMVSFVPSPGDAFMLLNSGSTGHTGLVYWVSPDGEHYYTIEGNCGNRVKVGRRSMSARNHKGFINLAGDVCAGFQKGDLAKVRDVGSHGTR